MSQSPKPRVFVDSDVLFAGAAASTEHGASLVVLRLAEITLIDAIASAQVIVEVERNLIAKLPQAVARFRVIVERCLTIVPDPKPEDLNQHAGSADPKDLPILVAAVRENCPWLVTFNGRHFESGHPDVRVMRPGKFVLRVRDLLASLTLAAEDDG